ncbi:MAG: formate dehydrogenase accessory sulfurtransferase FdhD [Deltaproteobacteria bacterium]|nr:formate dehydrogenase accessory sulfurtransferase FdhD [Candidatus Anaeroferrophillus wilburensis]MBN2890151.1 formate dehydrogenase accessory sulfurtransferase FdhD [Deltaproteobacteria bacterium]
MKNTTSKTELCEVLHLAATGKEQISRELIVEEPLLIRLNGSPYTVIMRTPGDELGHAAGFCLTDGIIESMADVATIGHCTDLDPNVVEIRLSPAREGQAKEIISRRGFISQTSCGICGRELVKEILQDLKPIVDDTCIPFTKVVAGFDLLGASQNYYGNTRGSHAAILCDQDMNLIASAEDVGRHNAMDKAIGTALMRRTLGEVKIAVVSSRLSYELVQKAARATIPILLSLSRPTSLAVDTAKQLAMTLACSDKEGGLLVFCNRERLQA